MDIGNQLQKDAKTLLEKMGFQFLGLPTIEEEDGRYLLSVFVDDPKSLIGDRGANLSDFQQIFRLIASRKYDPDIRVDIDVNGYKKKRQELIRDMAFSARRRALVDKAPVELEPMSSYDRRVIHATLASFPDVATASAGEGRSRRVIVSPQ
ncbi:MAG: R3H domain-containing nucleic acid-binding protein [Candidatus Spechtbacterales bacterium]